MKTLKKRSRGKSQNAAAEDSDEEDQDTRPVKKKKKKGGMRERDRLDSVLEEFGDMVSCDMKKWDKKVIENFQPGNPKGDENGLWAFDEKDAWYIICIVDAPCIVDGVMYM